MVRLAIADNVQEMYIASRSCLASDHIKCMVSKTQMNSTIYNIMYMHKVLE